MEAPLPVERIWSSHEAQDIDSAIACEECCYIDMK